MSCVVLLDDRVSPGAKHDSVVGAGAIPPDAKENRYLSRHADERPKFQTEITPKASTERPGKVHKRKRALSVCVGDGQQKDS